MATSPDNLPTTRTTMNDLRPAAAEGPPGLTMGFATLQSFELMQRAGKLLASSTLVPQQYQGQLANCVIALNMAQRIGADPLLVMQNLYIVHGRPAWSAQFMIACFNQCGRFSSIRYRWGGTQGQDDWSCQAYATELSTGDVIEGPVISLGLAKKEGWYQKTGSKWQSIPQLMLMYRAAAWLVRTHAPEISMGLQTSEEIHDVYDAERSADGHYEVTLDRLREAAEAKTAELEAEKDAPAETVDTDTGEVNPGGTTSDDEPQQQSAIPQYDAETAEKALRKCKSTKAIEKLWREIQQDFAATDREMPLNVEAAYDEMFEALEEKEAKL